jgi:hypothetical protein
MLSVGYYLFLGIKQLPLVWHSSKGSRESIKDDLFVC